MANSGGGWSTLWKTEDWLAVWVGFTVIAIVLVGLKLPVLKFKWVTEGEFASFAAEAAPGMAQLAKQAQEKGETGLATAAEAVKTALEKKDRKETSAAVKKYEEAAKESKDASLKKKADTLGKEVKSASGNLIAKIFSGENLAWSVGLGVGIMVLSMLAMALLGNSIGKFIVGFPLVFIISWIAQFIAGNYTVQYFGIEYVLWCLVLGLFVSNVIGLPEWMRPAVQTEFYIKTGLVILGSGVLFTEIVQAGSLGIVQALAVVGVVWYFCYWVCRRFGIDQEFSAILSSAVSICGVSAAIATSGAIKGDPKKLSYTTSIVLICAVPMMVLQPLISKWCGIPDAVAGAWLGGTLDTSGSVVAAGALISETAMKVGVIVKMSQNVLIGFAAFILAVVWTMKQVEQVPGADRPGAIEIWNRFPKFVLGFMIASLVFSFLLDPAVVKSVRGSLGGLRNLWFALAFVSIGLETRFSELATLGGGRPAIAFLIAQGFNVIWTLILAYLIFGGILFAVPKF